MSTNDRDSGARLLPGAKVPIDDLEHRHITVLIKGLRPEHERVLRAVGALDRLASEHHLFNDLDEAIAHARVHAARTRSPTSAPSARSCSSQTA